MASKATALRANDSDQRLMHRALPIPPLLLEQLLLAELAPQSERCLWQILQRQEREMERFLSLWSSSSEILSRYPPPQMAEAIQHRWARTGFALRAAWHFGRRRYQVWIVVTVAAATTVLLAILLAANKENPWAIEMPDSATTQRFSLLMQPSYTQRLDRPQSDLGHARATPRLFIYRKMARGVVMVTPHSPALKAGDLLQLAYYPGHARYGVIFSTDGNGGVTLHLPATMGGSTELTGVAMQVVPYAFELDDALGFERFFFVTADEPIDVRRLLSAGRMLAGDSRRVLHLPSGWLAKELLVKKAPCFEGKGP